MQWNLNIDILNFILNKTYKENIYFVKMYQHNSTKSLKSHTLYHPE